MKKKFITALFLFVACVTMMAQSLETDPLVRTLREELEYNSEQLKKQDVPAYFLSLRLVDSRAKSIVSRFGVSSVDSRHDRIVAPQVRVGSPELDNYKFNTQNTATGSRGDRGVSVPIEVNNLMPYRMAIWQETNNRYNWAVSKYEDAKAKKSTSKDNEDKAPYFSAAPVERYYEAPLPDDAVNIDEGKWRRILDNVTRVFKEKRDFEDGSVYLTVLSERKYFVNTEGTTVVQNRLVYLLSLQASIKAPDGLNCPLGKEYMGLDESELPDEATLMADAKDIAKRLYALRDAPLADPYAGPAIMSGGASGVFFHEIFGHRLEAHRMKKGGQTFKSMVGEDILPAAFNVYSDPTLKKYGNQSLFGSYVYDDEGVKARRVQNVTDGKLSDFLLGRLPIEGFLASNGHGRAAGGTDPVARQSNLIIETSKPYTEVQLRQMLKDEAKRQGKEFGYFVNSATSGLTFTGEGNTINSFNVDPVEVYRVFVDGRPDQLVRGVTLIGTPLAMFSSIEAGGDTPSVFTGTCGAESGNIPVTAISPMIFVSKIETQRNVVNAPLPRVLPMPEYEDVNVSSKGKKEDFVLKAMTDEMARTKSSMKSKDYPLPFFVDYKVNVGKSFVVSACGGDIISVNYTPKYYSCGVGVTLGDKMNMTSLYNFNMYSPRYDYDNLRRDFWTYTDLRYKSAIEDLSKKNDALKNRPLPEEDVNIPDFLELPAKECIMEPCADKYIDTLKLVNLAREVSAVANDFPRLTFSIVQIDFRLNDKYHVTSEGLRMRVPKIEGTIRVNVSAKTVDGSTAQDTYVLCFDDIDKIPSVESVKENVRDMMKTLMEICDAEAVKEYYSGPLLLEDEAVSEAFYRSVGLAVCRAQRNIYSGSGRNSMMLDKRIIDTKLNITQLTDIESYNGVELVGNYSIDANGVVPARSLPLVEKGIMRNMLCGRIPAVGAVKSTGAEVYRFGKTFTDLDFGVIRVSSEKTIPQSKMRAVFVSEAKKAGLKYAYIVKAPRNRWRYLVRLDIETGEEKIVRVKFIPQPSRVDLMHVSAVSREEFVTNKWDNADTFVSCIVPKSIIVENMEVYFEKPSRQKNDPLVSPSLRDAAK